MSSMRQASTVRETQTRTKSLIETTTQLGIGFFVSMMMWRVVVGPILGHDGTYAEAFWITAVFTVSSFIRHYFVRRGFERWG